MEELFVSLFVNFISNRAEKPYGKFTSFLMKIKCRKEIKQLKTKLALQIRNKYQNEIYYNALDKYLVQCDYFNEIIDRSYHITDLLSIQTSLNYYIDLLSKEFVSRNSQYAIYQNQIQIVLMESLRIVFDQLNDYSKDDTARLMVNILSEKLALIYEKLDTLEKIINNTIVNTAPINTAPSFTEENIKRFKTYLCNMYTLKSNYISRNIFSDNGAKETTVNLFLNQNRILLLGEPGSGKTIEAINLLHMICNSDVYRESIPVFFSLAEYGVGFKCLFDGVNALLYPFFGKMSNDIIFELIENQKLVLILDGFDEITTEENRIKFISEINRILGMANSRCFISSRINQYHNNFCNINQYQIEDLPLSKIIRILHDHNIYNVPDAYYDLFKKPLFLEIGIKVLSDKDNQLHNKSMLFKKYFYQLLFEREKTKGVNTCKTNLYETLFIIGKLAYVYFENTSISFDEFDELFHKNNRQFSSSNISDIFRIDVFEIQNAICFSHKQFKEFFAAYYLVHQYPIESNVDLYSSYMSCENWQEVIVFVAGMIENLEQQKIFFELLLNKNFRTYIECTKYGNDLSNELLKLPLPEYAQYYLRTLYDSYTSIIEKYFNNIKPLFEPMCGRDTNQKLCIVGCFYNANELTYWFDWKDSSQDDVLIIDKDCISDEYRDMEQRAIKGPRNITTHFINLEKANYSRNSSRSLALQIVRDNLIDICKRKLLKESDYILCERLYVMKKDNKPLRDLDVSQLFEWSSKYISDILQRTSLTSDVTVFFNHTDVSKLNYIARQLNEKGISFSTHLLPQPDQTSGNVFWVWDLYSDEQKINLVRKFFYWRERSYIEMIHTNFPEMMNYFKTAKDYPYRYKITITLKPGQNDVNSIPIISYYYLSCAEGQAIDPEVIVNRIQNDSDSSGPSVEESFKEIEKSYSLNNKKSYGATYTQTVFDVVIFGHDSSSHNIPLTDCVYRDFENDINNLFGKK